MEYKGDQYQIVYQVGPSLQVTEDHDYVEEMEEESPLDATNFFKQQPATQRFLCCKTSGDCLSEIKELKDLVLGLKKQLDDQEVRMSNQIDEIKCMVERHENVVGALKTKVDQTDGQSAILNLPNLQNNKNLYSNIDAFEDWIEKDLDKFRSEMIQKRDQGIWPKADDAIAAYFTKAKFRSSYTRSRAVVGKRTFSQSVFCNLIREVYHNSGEDSMSILVDKYRK